MKWVELIVIYLHAMMLLCQHVDGASPRAAAVVAVAVAVDELLQTNTPALPDELKKENATPAPVVHPACQCGCDRTDGCKCCDKTKQVAAPPTAWKPPEVCLVKTPNCTYCDQLESVLKAAGIPYSNRVETYPGNKYSGYPVLEMKGRVPLVGFHKKDAVLKWMRGEK